jgi:hypothetical protein
MNPWPRIKISLALVVAAGGAVGCASMISSAASNFADNLSAAVLNQDDPETVRDGAPAYLLLLDSMLEGSPDDPALLAAAANLYASYGAVFANDPDRARRMTNRARTYGIKGLCQSYSPSCNWKGMPFDQYESTLAGLGSKQAVAVYAYSVASLAYIRAHSDDWNALAELPHIEALLNRYLEIGDGQSAAAVYGYLGILATLRPPALGGEPEKGRQYFERSIDLTGGTDLGTKVEFARGYARLLYEREMHDELLREVLAADPYVPGYTLTNVLAQRDAIALLASANDYF